MGDTYESEIIEGDTRVVVSAPHGHDRYTGELVRAICHLTGFAGVIACHEQDGPHRVNVNRPTEKAGVDPDEEEPTLVAARIYSFYLKDLMEASQGNLNLYVEVHSNDDRPNMEVASHNVPPGVLIQVRELCREKVDAGTAVEGIDSLKRHAEGNKLFGCIDLFRSALHFEVTVGLRAPKLIPKTAVGIAEAIRMFAELSESNHLENFVSAVPFTRPPE